MYLETRARVAAPTPKGRGHETLGTARQTRAETELGGLSKLLGVRVRQVVLDGRREPLTLLAMRLTVNGDLCEIPDGLSVKGLIEHLGLNDGPVAVERNRHVVPRAAHDETLLANDDVIEIVHFVGGG